MIFFCKRFIKTDRSGNLISNWQLIHPWPMPYLHYWGVLVNSTFCILEKPTLEPIAVCSQIIKMFSRDIWWLVYLLYLMEDIMDKKSSTTFLKIPLKKLHLSSYIPLSLFFFSLSSFFLTVFFCLPNYLLVFFCKFFCTILLYVYILSVMFFVFSFCHQDCFLPFSLFVVFILFLYRS